MSATQTNRTVAERTMSYGLKALGRIAGSQTLDKVGMRKGVQRAIYHGSRGGFRSATAAGRSFHAARTLGRPARQANSTPGGLFDLTPDEEQHMLTDAVSSFATQRIRPAAADADTACATPESLLAEIDELGVAMLGIPEELGGVMGEQAAVTTILVTEALAHGDMGIACAALAPGAVASAIGRWGDAEQQATYLPAFAGEHPPAAALAILEPRPLFDATRLQTQARQSADGWTLTGVKSLVPRASEAELFIIAADTGTAGPALFIVESSSNGLFTEPEPAMGLRAAATGRLTLEGVQVPESAMLGDGGRELYSECVHRARLAWCAMSVGAAQAVLDHVIPYVKERKAFGEPIANRQAVAFAVSDIAIETAGMRLAALRAASRADEGVSFNREGAIARQLCARYASTIGSEGVQLLGGHGYIKEHPVERWYRDLAAAGVMEGALLI
jgi:alkylation response protein AidB-like acyl-CoA dehydrogenase